MNWSDTVLYIHSGVWYEVAETALVYFTCPVLLVTLVSAKSYRKTFLLLFIFIRFVLRILRRGKILIYIISFSRLRLFFFCETFEYIACYIINSIWDTSSPKKLYDSFYYFKYEIVHSFSSKWRMMSGDDTRFVVVFRDSLVGMREVGGRQGVGGGGWGGGRFRDFILNCPFDQIKRRNKRLSPFVLFQFFTFNFLRKSARRTRTGS